METPTIKLTYLDMIVQCIGFLRTRRGCSRQSIKAYIQNFFKKSSTRFDSALRNALIRGVEQGILIQNKQTFKLSPKGKQYLKKFK